MSVLNEKRVNIELLKLWDVNGDRPQEMVEIVGKNRFGEEITIRGRIQAVLLKETSLGMREVVLVAKIKNVQTFRLNPDASMTQVSNKTLLFAFEGTEVLRASVCNSSELLEKLPNYTCCILDPKPDYTPSFKDIAPERAELRAFVPAEVMQPVAEQTEEPTVKPVVQTNLYVRPMFDGPNDFLGGN